MKILYLLSCIAFPVMFAFRNAAQFKQLMAYKKVRPDTKFSQQWHRWQFGIQILFAAVIALGQDGWFFMLNGFLMSGALFWLIFDITLNLLCDRPGLYLSDKGIDRIIGKLGMGHLIIKLMLVVLFIVWFFINPFF